MGPGQGAPKRVQNWFEIANVKRRRNPLDRRWGVLGMGTAQQNPQRRTA